MKKTVLILVILAFLAGCATTGQSPEPSLKAGDDAPDFSLADVSGNSVKLSDFKAKKNIVLIFYTDFKEGGNPN